MLHLPYKQTHLCVMLALATMSLPTIAAETEEATLPLVKATALPISAGSPEDVARTGSKTDTPLRDIPASVAVVPDTLLREQGATTMNDAMRNVSSIQPLMGGGYGFANNYTSRGLALSFLRDDMPDGTAQNGYFRTMYDVERIEVLKGPGSALYGSMGPGGSINIITKKPSREFNIEAGATLGSYGTRNTYIDATGAITEGAEGRLIADVEHTNGFRGLERDIVEVSPTVTLHIADDKTLTVDFDHRDIEVKPDNYGILFDDTGRLPKVSRDTRYYTPFNYTDQEINRLGLTHDWVISKSLSMRTALVYEERELDLLRNAGGAASTAVVGGIGSRTLRQQSDDARYATLQNELTWKVSTGPVDHTVLGGVEFTDTSIDTVRVGYNLSAISDILNPVISETSLAGLTPVASQGFNRSITSDTASVYVQDQLAFGEHFKIRASIRDDRVSYEDDGIQGTTTRTIEAHKNLTSGSLGAVFQPTRNLSFYAGYSKGAFFNIATEATAVPQEPEKSKQMEIGTKATLFGGKADVNLALFDTRRENYFITLPGALSPTPDGKDESRGVEMDVNLHPMTGWNITGNAVWMNPKTKSNVLASNTVLGVVNQSIYGNRPAGVSKQTVSIWNSYQIQGGMARGLMLGIGATHKSDAYADSLNLLKVPSYTVYDAAVSYQYRQWETSLNLKNLTDKTYYINPTFSGALPGDPRSAYVTVRYNFN